jgi:hypothetical protein
MRLSGPSAACCRATIGWASAIRQTLTANDAAASTSSGLQQTTPIRQTRVSCTRRRWRRRPIPHDINAPKRWRSLAQGRGKSCADLPNTVHLALALLSVENPTSGLFSSGRRIPYHGRYRRAIKGLPRLPQAEERGEWRRQVRPCQSPF